MVQKIKFSYVIYVQVHDEIPYESISMKETKEFTNEVRQLMSKKLNDFKI